jgi:hypothetical protein
MKNKKWFMTAVITIVLSVMPICASAYQSLPPGFDDNVDDETPAAPISGLVALGLLAGAGYGIKKIKNANSKKQKS